MICIGKTKCTSEKGLLATVKVKYVFKCFVSGRFGDLNESQGESVCIEEAPTPYFYKKY